MHARKQLLLLAGLLTACSHPTSSAEVEQAVVVGCGVAPTWPCASATCIIFDDGTHDWEPVPYPAGRSCGTWGHCDGESTDCIGDVPPLTPPALLEVYQSQDPSWNPYYVQVTFDCGGGNGNTQRVYASQAGAAYVPVGTTYTSCAKGAARQEDLGVHPSTHYCYYVLNTDATGSLQSPTVCIDTKQAIIPDAPIGSVDPNTAGGTLNFTDMSNNEDSFDVYIHEFTYPDTLPWELVKHFDRNASQRETVGQLLSAAAVKYDHQYLSKYKGYEYKVVTTNNQVSPPVSIETVFPFYIPGSYRPKAPYNLELLFDKDYANGIPIYQTEDGTSKGALYLTYSYPDYSSHPPPAYENIDNTGVILHNLTTGDSKPSPLYYDSQAFIEEVTFTDLSYDLYIDNLSPGQQYCFTVTATNGTYESDPSNVFCVTIPLAPAAFTATLQPSQGSGLVLNTFSFPAVAGGHIDSVSLPSNLNDARVIGIVLVPPSATDVSACMQSNSLVYLPAAAEGGRKPSNDEMVLLYGSAKPPLDAGFVVKGCMIYTAPGNGPVSMRLEYLGSGAPPACTDPTACGGECGTFTNSCGMVDCGQCCVPNPNPCPSSQCGGSAPDGCGGFVDCHADCSSTSQCKCGGKCQNNACICNQNPCP